MSENETEANFYDASTYLFGNPVTFLDFCQELLKLIPPLRAAITFTKSNPRENINMKIHILNDEHKLEIIMIHDNWVTAVTADYPSTSEKSDLSEKTSASMSRIAPDLKFQVTALDEEFRKFVNDRTQTDNHIKSHMDDRMDKMESKIQGYIQQAVAASNQQLLTTNVSLHESIKEGTQTAAKLTGELNKAND